MAENTSNQTKMDAQKALTSREKGSSFCLLHKKTPFTFTCDDCNNELICVFCISKNHKGHKATLKETTAELCVKFLKKFQQEEKASIETGRKRITLAQKCYKESESFYDKEIKRIEKQNDELIQSIETYTKSLISSLENLKKKNEMRLLGCVNEVNSSIEAKHYLVNASTEALESNSDVFIIDSTYQIKKLQGLLPNILKPLSGVHFVPADITETCTRYLFGTLERESSRVSVSECKHEHQNIQTESNCVSAPPSLNVRKDFVSIGIQASKNLSTFTKCLETSEYPPCKTDTKIKYTQTIDNLPSKKDRKTKCIQTESNLLYNKDKKIKFTQTTSEMLCKKENQNKCTQTDSDFLNNKYKTMEYSQPREQEKPNFLEKLCTGNLLSTNEAPKSKLHTVEPNATLLQTKKFSKSKSDLSISSDTNETTKTTAKSVTTNKQPDQEQGKPLKTETRFNVCHKLFFKPRCIVQMQDGTWCTCAFKSVILHFFNDDFTSSETYTLDERVSNMTLGPNNTLYLLYLTGFVALFNTKEKRCSKSLFRIHEDVGSIGITPEENILSCSYYQQSISLFKKNGDKLKRNNYLNDYPIQVSVCQQTGKIALGCRSSLLVLNAELQILYFFEGDAKYISVWGVGFDPYGHVLCTQSETYQSKLYVLEAKNGKIYRSFNLQHFGYPLCMAVKNNGHAVVGMDNDQQIVSVNYLQNDYYPPKHVKQTSQEQIK